jgi:hypothetical protein
MRTGSAGRPVPTSWRVVQLGVEAPEGTLDAALGARAHGG